MWRIDDITRRISDVTLGTAIVIEFLYLLPVNVLILFLAFRSWKRVNAGLLVVLTGMLYAPVRFFLDFLRLALARPPARSALISACASRRDV